MKVVKLDVLKEERDDSKRSFAGANAEQAPTGISSRSQLQEGQLGPTAQLTRLQATSSTVNEDCTLTGAKTDKITGIVMWSRSKRRDEELGQLDMLEWKDEARFNRRPTASAQALFPADPGGYPT